jgi:hypothetical protein
MMGCEYIPAIFTGDNAADNKANTELYLKLVKEGEEKGFCPVLVERDIMYYVSPQQYGFTDSKEDYPKITKRIINRVQDNCFSVWMGRIIYNYYMDCAKDDDDVKEILKTLNPPDDIQYLKKFEEPIEEKDFSLGKDEGYEPYDFDFDYENYVFALVPTFKPWEVLAWIPIGGFNWCPDALHQTALAKELYECFGARIMHISFNTLVYYVPDTLLDMESVRRASRILIAADDDVYEDYEVAADRILGSHKWVLWWD